MKMLGLLNLAPDKQRGLVNFVFSTVMNNVKDGEGNHCFQTHLNQNCDIVAAQPDGSAAIIDVFGAFGQSDFAQQYVFPYISYCSILDSAEFVHQIFFQNEPYTVREVFGKAPKGRSLNDVVEHDELLQVILERFERVDKEAAHNALNKYVNDSRYVVVGDLRNSDVEWVNQSGLVIDFSTIDTEVPAYQWHNEVYQTMFREGFFD